MSFSICALSTTTQCHAQTVLNTDVINKGGTSGSKQLNAFQVRCLQKLPAAFYVNSDVESTFRLETNVYQTAPKQKLMREQLPLGTQLSDLSPIDQQQFKQSLYETSREDQVFRASPNITAGWSVTPNTQVFTNFFLIRDCLMRNARINSTTKAVGLGAQYTWNINKKLSFQPQIIARELYQSGEPDVFDYLPAATLQYQVTPNLSVYANSLLQVRFRHFIQGPMMELDPFHTIGCNYQRGDWTFVASGTFNQNFRHQFRPNAIIPINNYSYVLDFEIDRPVAKKLLPGLQSVMRVEPVLNFHSNGTPSLSGNDLRLYYGLRLSATKPPLTADIDELRKQFLSKGNDL